MSAESDNPSGFGMQSALGWPIGGAIGGIVGAAAFGVLMWLFDPEIVEAAIPALYGFDPASLVGWSIQLGHGAVLGVIFGFFVTRTVVLGILRTNVETDALANTGETARVVAAGFVYGLLVWTLLPVIILPVWTGVAGTEAAADFPGAAVESLVGHLLFGVVLGAVFGGLVDLTDRATGDPLEGDQRV